MPKFVPHSVTPRDPGRRISGSAFRLGGLALAVTPAGGPAMIPRPRPHVGAVRTRAGAFHDAATRRQFLALIAAGGLLTACADDDDDAAPAATSTPTTRSVPSDNGPVTVPSDEPGSDKIAPVAPYVGLDETEATAGVGWDFQVPMKSWDSLFLSVCDAVGRRDRGLELVQELEAKIDDLARRRATAPQISVARIEFYEAGTFSWRGQTEDTAELMRRIGIDVVGPDQSESEVSLERLPEIDADWLVIPVGGNSMPQDVYDQVAASEIFQQIPAVQAGRVITVDGALWRGLGYLWAVAMVEELDRIFGSGDPSATASPSPTT